MSLHSSLKCKFHGKYCYLEMLVDHICGFDFGKTFYDNPKDVLNGEEAVEENLWKHEKYNSRDARLVRNRLKESFLGRPKEIDYTFSPKCFRKQLAIPFVKMQNSQVLSDSFVLDMDRIIKKYEIPEERLFDVIYLLAYYSNQIVHAEAGKQWGKESLQQIEQHLKLYYC